MNRSLKILILEDDLDDAELTQMCLLKSNIPCEFRIAVDKNSFLENLEEYAPEVILSDSALPQFSSGEALKIIRLRQTQIPFILVTGNVSEEFAAGMIKMGADDYILKDQLARLPAAITSSLRHRRLLKELDDYKYAVDHSSIISIADALGKITYANDNFFHISKYTKEEIIGKDYYLLNSGCHSASFIKNVWETISHDKIWKGDFCNKAKDGSIYWEDITIVPFMNENKIPYQYLFISTDITQRKLIEDELNKSLERFKHATQATSDIIWELNFDTKKFIVHEPKEKLFDVDKVLSLQMGIHGESIFKADRKRVMNSFAKSRMDLTKNLWKEEYRVYATDNSTIYIVNHAVFIRNERGLATKAIGAITDISEKKRLEMELFEQQRDEHLKTASLVLEAQEKERNNIAMELHDNVNQILVGVKLLLALARDNPKNASPGLMSTCITHLEEVIHENRKIAHELIAPDFTLDNLQNHIFQLIESMIKPTGIDVRIITNRLNESLLDNQQKLAIYRIAQEQSANIIKYANATNITFVLQTVNDDFKMSISDDGIGMNTKQKITGMGLRNIRGRLSILNGSINIQTSAGNGFILEIQIPCNK